MVFLTKGWVLISISVVIIAVLEAGCAIYPESSTEPRAHENGLQQEPPPEVERIPPPKPPSTTCPSAMKGSC